MEKQKRILFPRDLFDGLVDEAIEDLCKTGLEPKEIYRILNDSLGSQIAERYVETLQKSERDNNKNIIATDQSKGVKTK